MSADGNGSDRTSNGAQVVKLPRTITVRELGELLRSTPVDVIKELMKRGVMVAINQSVEYDMAASVAQELGFEPQPEEAGASGGTAVAVAEEEAGDEDEKLQARDGARRPRKDEPPRRDPRNERHCAGGRRHHSAHRRLPG